MSKPIITEADFDVFQIPGLEARMQALIGQVRPKLEELGGLLAPTLTGLCGHEMIPHVARHARRTVNPPADTWVAWANSKRGYKALPHFQLGLWSTHLFIQFAVIYESPNKEVFADHLLRQLDDVKTSIPSGFFWSVDHTQPEVTPHAELDEQGLSRIAERLKQVKKAEALCGLRLDRQDPLLRDGDALLRTAEETFTRLLSLYRMAF
ncbi:UPF0637 protein YktB [Paenibacillus sp. J31TS4]|uniref:YktB family protein n=1 Tax=Paenibacillus sp. J31TS4 TaxID=2807195 RepID=UPI001B240E21|nr:DUF1054 domain-containing protein [Paenibacillus sp. J31TS4]GIP39750.1 UPF0637 protein YktB [Paenibacillus sp. J31TS4]